MKELFNISNHTVINPAQSVLMLELGESYCCFIIMKREGFEAEKLVYYEGRQEEELLRSIVAGHQELTRSFSEVLINYSFPQSIMTPSKFYSSDDSRKMLRVMYSEMNGAILSEHLAEWHLYNIYEVPKDVHSWISMQFHSGKYWHSYSSVLENLSADRSSDVLLIDFKTGQFSAIVIKPDQLQLTQTFNWSDSADVIYYLLKICNQFSISQKDARLVLSGLIEDQSALYRELYNYFGQISFKQIPDFIKLPPSFEQYPTHFFSSLFNLAVCVS